MDSLQQFSAIWYVWVGLFLQFATLVALIWYAIETRNLRKTSEAQLEGLSQPCLSIAMERRSFIPAVSEEDGTLLIAGNGSVDDDVSIMNIVKGAALNVAYYLKFVGFRTNENVSEPMNYVPCIAAGSSQSIPLYASFFSTTDYDLKLDYESLSGIRYRTVFQIRSRVVIKVDFCSPK